MSFHYALVNINNINTILGGKKQRLQISVEIMVKVKVKEFLKVLRNNSIKQHPSGKSYRAKPQPVNVPVSTMKHRDTSLKH